MGEMTLQEIDRCVHELVAIQQMFKSFEKLADNPCFHFRPAQFHKAVLKIQVVIDSGRQIGSQLKEQE